jgi:septum formation protein
MSGLVLASRSASRAAILACAGVSFRVAESGLDERPLKVEALARGQTPHEIAAALADRKAVVGSLSHSSLVLAADQTLELEGRLYDKVDTLEQARERLNLLRGRTHRLHSAAAFAKGGQVIWRTIRIASLAMRALSDTFVEDYLANHGRRALASSGCYLLEEVGAQLFDDVTGDYFSILGLPLLPVLGFLRSEGLLAT